MKWNLWIGIVALVFACGCVSLSTGGAAVRITANPDVVKDCKFVGQVSGSDHMWGGTAAQGIAEQNATAELQNKAADMGANTVFLARSSTGFSGSSQLGEAYVCPALKEGCEALDALQRVRAGCATPEAK